MEQKEYRRLRKKNPKDTKLVTGVKRKNRKNGMRHDSVFSN